MPHSQSMFPDDPLVDFHNGCTSRLIANRNAAVGNLLSSERALFYLQIVYRMLLFRRAHELEPLHEDLYAAVRQAQEIVSAGRYGIDQYNLDINQLLDWNLISVRLEKERIRGYKDTRRTKYRYALGDETVAFLRWLEERMRDDLEDRQVDARDLLEELVGTARELNRLILSVKSREPDENESRRMLFQIYKLDQITDDIGSSLTEFNARLISFLLREYNLAELRELIEALGEYVEKYLLRIGDLRSQLLPELAKLKRARNRSMLVAAHNTMEAQRRSAPRFLRSGTGAASDPLAVPEHLRRFYREEGALDGYCHRINDSALRVLRRMSVHLKELERKSHRIEDLRERMREMAQLDEKTAPHAFINAVLGWGHMRSDPHAWDELHPANPPRPRRTSWRHRVSPSLYLKPKKAKGESVRSMEQARLERLRTWMEQTLNFGDEGREAAVLLSSGQFTDTDDGQRIIELARAGLLGRGRKLREIGYDCKPLPEHVAIELHQSRLRCNELQVRQNQNGDNT